MKEQFFCEICGDEAGVAKGSDKHGWDIRYVEGGDICDRCGLVFCPDCGVIGYYNHKEDESRILCVNCIDELAATEAGPDEELHETFDEGKE
jgi:hypothetical protein